MINRGWLLLPTGRMDPWHWWEGGTGFPVSGTSPPWFPDSIAQHGISQGQAQPWDHGGIKRRGEAPDMVSLPSAVSASQG